VVCPRGLYFSLSSKNIPPLVCIPAFTDVIIDNEERTAIKLIVEPR
jgi:stage V sporulation protein SpoVS